MGKNRIQVPKCKVDERKALEAMLDGEKALELAQDAIEKLQIVKEEQRAKAEAEGKEVEIKPITKDEVVEYLADLDFRNMKYKTWITMHCAAGRLPGIEEMNTKQIDNDAEIGY